MFVDKKYWFFFRDFVLGSNGCGIIFILLFILVLSVLILGNSFKYFNGWIIVWLMLFDCKKIDLLLFFFVLKVFVFK